MITSTSAGAIPNWFSNSLKIDLISENHFPNERGIAGMLPLADPQSK
jgi:hypothetical protein